MDLSWALRVRLWAGVFLKVQDIGAEPFRDNPSTTGFIVVRASVNGSSVRLRRRMGLEALDRGCPWVAETWSRCYPSTTSTCAFPLLSPLIRTFGLATRSHGVLVGGFSSVAEGPSICANGVE